MCIVTLYGQITYQKINYQKTRYTVRVTFAVKKHANTDIKHQIYAKSTLKYIRLNDITSMGVKLIKSLIKKTQYRIVYKTSDTSSELLFLTKCQNNHKVTWNYKYNFRNISKFENDKDSTKLLYLLMTLMNKLNSNEISFWELSSLLPKNIFLIKL